MRIKKNDLVVYLALLAIFMALLIMFDSYGRLGNAYDICASNGGVYFG